MCFLRDESSGDWRIPHNEKPRDLYSTSSKLLLIQREEGGGWADNVPYVAEARAQYGITVGKSL